VPQSRRVRVTSGVDCAWAAWNANAQAQAMSAWTVDLQNIEGSEMMGCCCSHMMGEILKSIIGWS